MTKYIRIASGILLLGLLVIAGAAGYFFKDEILVPRERSPLSSAEKLELLVAGKSFPLVFAHRGDHLLAPENSLKAVMNAIQNGYDGVELDVTVTSDGVVILSHDVSVEWKGSIRSVQLLTFDELGNSDQHVEKLSTVLDQAKDRILFLLEMKSGPRNGGGVGTLLCDMILERHLERSVIVSSTDYFLIRGFQERCGSVHSMFEYSGPSAGLPLVFKNGYRSRLISLSIHSFTEQTARWLKGKNLQISVYTPNTVAEQTTALDSGADLIQTDFPGRLTALRNGRYDISTAAIENLPEEKPKKPVRITPRRVRRSR